MYNFNIILTEKCNADCSHCYIHDMINGERKTMSDEDIKAIVDNMPENTEKVFLTGGEIFLVKDLLYYAIDLIRKKNDKIEILLESNGKYLYENGIKEELQHLKKLGVNCIRSPDSPFHAEGGLDINRIRGLKKYEDETTPRIKYLVWYNALPFGRARNLPEERKARNNCMNTLNTVKDPYLFLDVCGNVHVCTWKCLPPIANMIKDDFEKIEEALNEPFNHLILQGNILEAINMIDNDESNAEFVEKYGECRLCDKVFHNRK